MKTLFPCLLLLSAFVVGQGEQEQDQDSLLERVIGLEKAYADAQQTFFQKYREAKGREAKQKVLREERPDDGEYGRKMLTLAGEAPESDAACRAWVWIVSNIREDGPKARALKGLGAHHLEREQLGKACERLQYDMTLTAAEFLERARSKSPHREVRGQACFALAQVRKRQATAVRDAERYRQFLGEETVAALEKIGAKKLEGDAEKLFEVVCKDYADCGGRAVLGKRAEAALFELRNLSIGKPAPEIVGTDADDVEFKLSDYKGKVVVIDFWGDW